MRLTIVLPQGYYQSVKCPYCQNEIDDAQIRSYSNSLIGRMGPPESKARDPKKMSRAGKKGGWPKGRKRTPKTLA